MLYKFAKLQIYKYNLTMENDIYKKTVEYLPEFFNIQLDVDLHGAGVFEPLRKIIDFDQGYIFFLNPDSVDLKYLFGKDRRYDIGNEFSINKKIKEKLFSDENLILNLKDEFINLINPPNSSSFLILKLIIKNTVYGFVLLCKDSENYYNNTNIKAATAIGSVISYKIKDIELSEIFKAQLKTLKDNVIQIREQNKKILEMDKIKNEFLANVSHELRTPLNAIIGFSEILSNKFYGDLNDKQLEYVKDIHVSGIHLLGMINELLDISKIEANAMNLNKTEFSLVQAVEEVVNTVRPLAQKKTISIDTNVVDGKVVADFQKIRQILYNLLSNAIKFTPYKGQIGVNVFLKNSSFIIEVQDNGIGIDPKDHQRIFEKFVQIENAYTKKESSTGLGLTITKELVEMHGGKITLESDLGKGTNFIVKIPA